MQDLLLSIVKKFDKEELKKWRNFMKSPYFNTNRTLVKMADYFVKLHPNLENLSKEKLFKSIYENKTYSINLLNTNFSRLEHLTFKFLSQEEFEKKESIQDYLLFDYLLSESFLDVSELVDKKWEQTVEKIEENLDSHLDNSENTYIHLARLYHYKKGFEVEKRLFGSERYDLLLTLNVLNANSSYYFLQQSRFLSCYASEFRNLEKAKIVNLPPLSKELQRMLDNDQFYTEDLLANLYLVTARLFANIGDRKAQLEYIYSVIAQKGNELDTNGLTEIALDYYNLCGSFEAETGDSTYFNFLGKLDELMLQKKLLSLEFLATPVIFYRMTASLFYLQKIPQLKSFIDQNKHLLPQQEQTFEYLIIQAQISLLEKRFKATAKYIDDIQSIYEKNKELKKSIFHSFYYKILPIKLFYETQEWEYLDRNLASYKVYIHRKGKNILEVENGDEKKLTEKQHRFVKNMIVLLRQRFDPAANAEKLKQFKVKTQKEAVPIIEKQWLLNKIDELTVMKKRNKSMS